MTNDPYNPLDRYNKLRLSNKSNEVLEDEIVIYYKEMYIQDRRGKNGLGDTNEELLWRKNGMTFIPGKIYTYDYDPKYKDYLSFYDKDLHSQQYRHLQNYQHKRLRHSIHEHQIHQ